IDPRTELGSDINDFNPCHAGGNQSKFYKAALGAYKAIYKYGLVKSILENRKIYFNDEVGDIDGWIVETSLSHFNFVLKPAIAGWLSGYYEAQMLPTTSTTKALSYDYTSYDNDVSDADTLKVVFVAELKLDFDAVGLYYQKARVTLKGDSGSDYYLNKSGEWTLSNT
ncbi:MAG: hypothetical protein GY739_07415, partial [Mesoflavibacter sp.]|nr:hypothetical protein [Mesoflavibacter sp.]